ncbi:MAG: response regulator transcription factor [Lachnospiraceae bacterium]|nr:response regulator transcription factor [Lachnospiraceae bacterium]
MEKKVLILEDNDKTAALISQLLQECGSSVKIYIEKDIERAYALVMQNRIHLFIIDIILDISRPGDTSGIRFIESVRSIAKYKYTPVIFITSLQDPEIYAYRELHCYGYIEKPFAVEQVKKLLTEALNCNIAGQDDCVLHFRKDGILYPIQCNEIIYAQSTNHTICFYLTNGTEFKISYKTCKQILEEAECDDLIQCNRGAIVNRKYISNIDIANGVITLRGNIKVDIGIKYRTKFIEALQW